MQDITHLLNNIIHADCLEVMRSMPDNCIDLVCTDPPYGYIKHRLDAPFDANEFFKQSARILKPTGGLIYFGRGVQMARWACLCDDLGLVHKEDIVWYKRNTSSPCHPLGRNHESAYLFGGPQFRARKAKIPAEETMMEVTPGLRRNIARMLAIIRKGCVDEFARAKFDIPNTSRNDNITGSAGIKCTDRLSRFYRMSTAGARECSVIYAPHDRRHTSIHPTQKPVRLFERLIAIASDPGAIVLDPFSGSGSCALAAARSGRQYIAIEIDEEYHRRSVERLQSDMAQWDLTSQPVDPSLLNS